MSKYTVAGGVYKVFSDEELEVVTKLPPFVYAVKIDNYGEYFLEKLFDSYDISSQKLYGDVIKDRDRILHTFETRDKSTGVLLAGEKGSGKTMLSKLISESSGHPTLVINQDHYGDKFNQFIYNIEQKCVVIFDEFEKIYGDAEQNRLLTLFDGVYPSRKLFILTVNSWSKVVGHMRNRPGRMWYFLKYDGLSVDFVRDYVEENLHNKDNVGQVMRLTGLLKFNFDMLSALVDEMNLYNESPSDSLRYLNITEPDASRTYAAKITVRYKGKDYTPDWIEDKGDIWANPLKGFRFEFGFSQPEGMDTDTWFESRLSDNFYLHWENKHIVSVDDDGAFHLKMDDDKHDASISLTLVPKYTKAYTLHSMF